MTRVKVCGITNARDALAAADAGADALGFVLAHEGRKRGRYISLESAAPIVAELHASVLCIAVCVNDSLDVLRGYLEVFDRVQLHGEEPPALANALGRRAIKAFRVGPGFDVAAMAPFETGAYLVDAFVPDSRGGTGTTCDWELAAALAKGPRPLYLAGGLDPENVSEAIERVRPHGVDVSGGIEASPGKKDHERIRAFIHAAKASMA